MAIIEEVDLNISLEPGGSIYFVGIGGIAMSAAANIARSLGYTVLGSDSKEVYPPAKGVLDAHKISYHIGYKEEYVKNNPADVYVLSAGEDLNNPEVKVVAEKEWPRVGLAELLYHFSQDKLRVVVAGTHGKSTTTGLVGHLLKNLDNSSFMAGAVLQNYENNFYTGDGHYFVFEGDEYKEQFDDPTPKFQYYQPDVLILTNLEFDHPDLFENFDALEREFRLLIEKMPPDGLIVYNADDPSLGKLVHESNISSVSFGLENEADFKAEQVQYGQDFTTMEIINKLSKAVSSKFLGQTEQYKIQLPGKINIYNSMAAIAALRALGFQQEQLALDLVSYKGVKRRFEVVGTKNGVVIVDDYAHHPTAVRETLQAARLRYPKAKIWAVFEPHTFSRTRATLTELSKSFEAANEILISEIYPAREKISEATVTSQEVVDAIRAHKPDVKLVFGKQQALDILKAEAKPGDIIIVMAVGSFNRLAYELKEKL